MPILRRTLLRSSALLASLPAQACTVCDSRNGHALRAGLFNGHFLHTLWLVLAPVPVFVLVVALVHFGMPDLDRAEDPHASPLMPAQELAA